MERTAMGTLTSRIGRIAAVAILLLGTACSRAGQTSVVSDSLRIAIPINPTQLNPILSQNSIESFSDSLLFNLLVSQDDRHRQIPDLAAVVPTLANGGIGRDGLTLTYHLRRNVRWQDGVPFTSHDVVYTWHAIMNPNNNVVDRRGFDLVSSMDTPDAYTVVMHMKKRFAPAVDTIFGESDMPLRVLPAHLLEKYADLNHVSFNSAPVGTGPYRFVRWLRGDRIELEANPAYFKGVPRIKYLTLKIITDDATVEAQLRSHETDLGIEITAPTYQDLASVDGVTRQLAQAPVYTAVQFNTQRPALQDARVRRALVLGMDRETIVRKNTFGTSRLAVADLSPFYWAFDSSLQPVPYDLQAAKSLLDSAGWHPGPDGVRVKNGQRLAVLLVYGTGSQIIRNIVAEIQQMYKPLGVEVDAKGFDYAILYAAAESGGIINAGKFDLAMYSWIAGADPDDSSQWSCDAIPPAGNNVARYCSAKMDALQRIATTNFDRGVRTRAYAQIQSLLLQDAPAAFIYYQALRYARVSDLRNFAPNGVSEAWNAQEWAR
jgi:peptide/nickel transport system substrate-binding protein